MTATVLVERPVTSSRRRCRVAGMRVISGEARKGGIGRACRGALASGVVAVAVMLCAVAAAHAQTETFELHFIPSLNEQSSAVTGIYQCQPAALPCLAIGRSNSSAAVSSWGWPRRGTSTLRASRFAPQAAMWCGSCAQESPT